jgi:cell division protein FtsB
MPEEKGLGKKLLGLFVEVKDDGTPVEGTPAVEAADDREKTPAELVAELAGQSAPKKAAPAAAGPAAVSAPPPPRAPSLPQPTGHVEPAKVDFDQVFKSAGMDPGDLDRVRKAEELLKGLPEATPIDVKRQIVEASLKAFGFDLAKIVGAAQNQLKALDTYVKINEQATVKGINDAQTQIAQLEDKIISLRADINKRTDQLAAITAAAQGRKGQVTQVLEFFNAPAVPTAKP